MANFDTKVKEYAKANGIASVDFNAEDVVLENDGSGTRIVEWNLDIPQPSASDLDAVASAADATEQAEADAVLQKPIDKANGIQKLVDLGLSQAEADALTK